MKARKTMDFFGISLSTIENLILHQPEEVLYYFQKNESGKIKTQKDFLNHIIQNNFLTSKKGLYLFNRILQEILERIDKPADITIFLCDIIKTLCEKNPLPRF